VTSAALGKLASERLPAEQNFTASALKDLLVEGTPASGDLRTHSSIKLSSRLRQTFHGQPANGSRKGISTDGSASAQDVYEVHMRRQPSRVRGAIRVGARHRTRADA
jgi:hypothetical protein